jgi:hypothetical protein
MSHELQLEIEGFYRRLCCSRLAETNTVPDDAAAYYTTRREIIAVLEDCSDTRFQWRRGTKASHAGYILPKTTLIAMNHPPLLCLLQNTTRYWHHRPLLAISQLLRN